MIEIIFRQASHFQNSNNSKKYSQLIKKKYLLIGRGQQLQQQQDKTHDIINLKDFDQSLSRIHAVIMFSPGWFLKNSQIRSQQKQQSKLPNYFYNFSSIWSKVPEQCLQEIWSFIKPSKKCILKDLNSKFGLYKSIKQEKIFQGMQISFGDNWILQVVEKITFNSIQNLVSDIAQFKQNNYKILGNLQKLLSILKLNREQKQKQLLCQIWLLKSYQNIQKREGEQKYLLLIQNNRFLSIGRSSQSDISLKSSSISRYQAYLKCENNIWKICDGDIKSKSLNGTWQKINKIEIKRTQQLTQKQELSQYRIGSIKCQIIVNSLPWLNFNKILNQNSQVQQIENFNLNHQ